MDSKRWRQIKKGMEKNGWKCVFELHPDLPAYIKESLIKDYIGIYPREEYHHQWYHNHRAYACFFVKRKEQPKISVEDNIYREPIIKRVDEQTLKGIKKYGTVLPQNTAPMLDRIEHIQQELTDALVYNEWIKDGFNKVADHAYELVAHLAMSHCKMADLSPDNPIRVDHEKAMKMAHHIAKELSNIGKDENEQGR